MRLGGSCGMVSAAVARATSKDSLVGEREEVAGGC
jgi:hypothetical protein